ncbi:hypothetical protein VOLCADRAFT_103333 [Volvox carteri f. nagariensis]|uniref:Uncharacterized protein n=1 Tax=Volvox carteri f. nagariensis TaxID=3068 RepID=D8TLA3_VOLCA|nr:uncharacterized protein VOLCADRAFT_103333 [Volvox carteri f. nagariensis]EFJ51839.1 hypothetical protein VOLCADRAFT_103333 [Volvox carteri f. nagariensis]|eukprot:XP_002947249.1 hypothetical protein VOLCADRAFT_103333 [Volvox carteri f. nagariensis]
MQLGGWGERDFASETVRPGTFPLSAMAVRSGESWKSSAMKDTLSFKTPFAKFPVVLGTGTSPPHVSGTDSRFSLCDQSLTSEQFPCFTNGVDAEIFFKLTTHSIHPFIVPVQHIVETRRESRDIRL